LSVSIKPAASKEDLADPLIKISHNLDFEDAADLYYQSDALEENFDDSSNFDSKEDFVDLYDGVSYGSNDEWMLGLELDDKEPTIFSSEPNNNNNNTCPQVYGIIEETSEDLDSTSNTLVNPSNLRRGSRYVASRTDEATITTREKVWLTTVEWTTIRVAVNRTTNIPSNASRSMLMGYQYLLHRQSRQQEQVRQRLEERRIATSASSLRRAGLSNTSDTNLGGRFPLEQHQPR
jgi:hypothetical protein